MPKQTEVMYVACEVVGSKGVVSTPEGETVECVFLQVRDGAELITVALDKEQREEVLRAWSDIELPPERSLIVPS